MILVLPLYGVFAQSGSLVLPDKWIEKTEIIYFTDDYPGYIILNNSSIEEVPKKALAPWTLQKRVAGFAMTADALVIGVNSGFPLLFHKDLDSFSAPGEQTAERFLDETSGLTTGIMYSEQGDVFFHFYRDSFFVNDYDSQTAGPAEPVLLEIGVSENGFTDLTKPPFGFSADNPGWEPVEMIRKSSDLLVSWKYSDEKKTRFRYIRHDAVGEPLAEIDEGYFRDEYNLKSLETGPFAFRGFIRAVRTGAAGKSLHQAGEIFISMSTSRPGKDFPVYYSSSDTSERGALPVQLSACADQQMLYVLSGGEVLLCGSNIRRLKLPALPKGFKYRKIWVSGDRMIISWEESRFPYTGRSGMMYIKMRDIFIGE